MDGGTVLFKRLNGDGAVSLNGVGETLLEMARKKKNNNVVVNSPLFLAARDNDITGLNKLMRQSYRLDERGPFGQHCLHIALLHDSNDVALQLMDTEPTLINSPVMSKVYLGETPLHVAIMNHNFLMVKELVRRGADVVTPRANGSFFQKGSKCGVYCGEYPLSFAACTGQVEVLRFLHQHGAALDAQDSYGNTALHLLATLTDTDTAKKMYDLIVSLDKDKKIGIEKISNHQSMTALKYTAYLGNTELFTHIMSRKKEVHWSYGPISSVIYNIEQIDSYQNKKSVLHMIANGKDRKKNCCLLNVQPVKDLLNHKWGYLRPWFLLFGTLYVIYMIIFTLVCYYRPTRLERFNSSQQESTFLDFYQNPIDYWRLVGELLSIFGALCMLFRTIPCLVQDKLKYFLTPGPGPLHIVNWCFCILVLILMVLRLLNVQGETAVMAVTLLLGWVHCIYYARAFETTGPNNVMLQKILVTDFLRFLLVYLTLLVGFSGAFTLLFKDIPNPPQTFSDYGGTMMALTKMMVGLKDLQSLEQATYPGVAVALYLFYLFTVAVLLLSFLIATILYTCNTDRTDLASMWKLQNVKLTLYLERSLPQCVKWRSGIPGSRFGRPSQQWYIRCEEPSSDPKRVVRCYHSAPDPSDDEGLSESQEAMWNNEAFDFGDVTQPNSVVSTPAHSRTASPQPYVIENNVPVIRTTSPLHTSTFQQYRATSPLQKTFPGNSRVSSPVQNSHYLENSLRTTPLPRAPNHQLYIDLPQNLQDVHPRARSPLRAVSPNGRSRTPADVTNITTEF